MRVWQLFTTAKKWRFKEKHRPPCRVIKRRASREEETVAKWSSPQTHFDAEEIEMALRELKVCLLGVSGDQPLSEHAFLQHTLDTKHYRWCQTSPSSSVRPGEGVWWRGLLTWLKCVITCDICICLGVEWLSCLHFINVTPRTIRSACVSVPKNRASESSSSSAAMKKRFWLFHPS